MELGSARDGDDPRLLRQEPGERHLRRRRVLPLADALEKIDQRLVGGHGFGREAWQDRTEIVRREFRFLAHRSGQEPLAERAVADEADAQFLAGLKDAVGLGPPRPERIFVLEGGHRLDGMRPAHRVRARLRQAEMADLALGDQRLHRARHLLDRRLRIDAVLVEEIDRLDLQALQRTFHRRPNAGRAEVQADLLAGLRIDAETELGRDHDFVAKRRQRLADHLLVGVGPVDLGGVEERDAALMGRADQRDPGRLVDAVLLAIAEVETHAAEADGGDLEAALAQLSGGKRDGHDGPPIRAG